MIISGSYAVRDRMRTTFPPLLRGVRQADNLLGFNREVQHH